MKDKKFEKFEANFRCFLSEAVECFKRFESVSFSFNAAPMERVKSDYTNEIAEKWRLEEPINPDKADELLNLMGKQIEFYSRVTLGKSVSVFGRRVAYIPREDSEIYYALNKKLEKLQSIKKRLKKDVERWRADY